MIVAGKHCGRPRNEKKLATIRAMRATGKTGIQIPDEAVLRTGERNVVFITRPGNKFALREVTLGMPLDNGKIQILAGLAPGETIVTSGQFLLDSESKLREAVSKMMDAKKSGKKAEAAPKPESGSDFFDDM